jgi:hypothetical protein
MSRHTTIASPTLRTTLQIDAIASGAMGVLLLLLASPAAPLLGLSPALLRGAGAPLLPFAALLFWLAPRASQAPAAVRAIVIANAAWVLASVVLLVSGVAPNVTLVGELFVVLQALVVVGFTVLEYRALTREGESLAPRTVSRT